MKHLRSDLPGRESAGDQLTELVCIDLPRAAAPYRDVVLDWLETNVAERGHRSCGGCASCSGGTRRLGGRALRARCAPEQWCGRYEPLTVASRFAPWHLRRQVAASADQRYIACRDRPLAGHQGILITVGWRSGPSCCRRSFPYASVARLLAGRPASPGGLGATMVCTLVRDTGCATAASSTPR